MAREVSIYGMVFDHNCPNWTDDKVYNILFLKHLTGYFNDLLRKRGYVFLRDIYEMLGFEITQASCLVGWYYDEKNKFVDNFIKFEIDDSEEGPNIKLDFNVDGKIIYKFM